MATIGIISDTHGTLDPRALDALAGCDVIIHAGDIGSPAILDELGLVAPVIAVLGNCDYPEYGPEVGDWARPVIDGVSFLIAHKPESVQLKGFGCFPLAPGEAYPQVCIHGHTHIPQVRRGGWASPAELVLCPGSATRPLGGSVRSVGRIVVEDGRVKSAQVLDLDGNVICE
ncbi:MAG: YfcE family phosphodiesterase [Eggerthellaceae bacterium]|nr:YfcE family phosphodiesterase [Eggerthellaceae bacterium]